MTGQVEDSSGFAERILEVIDSGRRVATYKLVRVALLDLCSSRNDQFDRHADNTNEMATFDVARLRERLGFVTEVEG